MRSLWSGSRKPGGFHSLRWRSQALSGEAHALVYLPHGYPSHDAHPVLYLLHGSGHSTRTVRDEILLDGQTEALGSALLVIPDGDQGWWLDSPLIPQSRYQSLVLELVTQVTARYSVSTNRRDTAICGFSMGGTGAILLAAQHSERFGAVSSLLGVLDIEALYPDYYRLRLLLGDETSNWQNANPLRCVPSLRDTRLFLCSATAGFDRPMNDRFVAELARLGIAHGYRAEPGSHDTLFARRHIAACFAFHRRSFDVP